MISVRYMSSHLVDQSIREIVRFIADAAYLPETRGLVVRILNDAKVTQMDRVKEAEAIYYWVQKRIRYVPDPWPLEWIPDMPRLLWIGGADCDGFDGLLGALLVSAGFPFRLLVSVQSGAQDLDEPTHVYGDVLVRGHWFEVDPSCRSPWLKFGQGPPGVLRSWAGQEVGALFMERFRLGFGHGNEKSRDLSHSAGQPL